MDRHALSSDGDVMFVGVVVHEGTGMVVGISRLSYLEAEVLLFSVYYRQVGLFLVFVVLATDRRQVALMSCSIAMSHIRNHLWVFEIFRLY